jgi:archaellum component FlaD/FlaE
MSKLADLRADRAAKIAELRAAKEHQLQHKAKAEEEIKKIREALERKERLFAERDRTTQAAFAEIDREIQTLEVEEKFEELRTVAANLDQHGHSAARLAQFDKLCAELAFAKCLSLANYEARQMNVRRMKRDPDVAQFGRPPFASWSAMAAAS